MLDVVAEVVGAGSSLTVFTVGFVLLRRLHSSTQRTLESRPRWEVARLPDGTWSVATVEKIPALGINEQTVYGGYTHEDASEVACWLNDETDLRSLPTVLLDAETRRKHEAEERESRRLSGGTPVYEMGRAEPVDYLCDQHVGKGSTCTHCDDVVGSRWYYYDRTQLEALARQRHHLTMRQMNLISREHLIRLLAHDEPPPAPSNEDIYTEYDLRQALYAWRESVRRNAPDDDLSVEQGEQLKFIFYRATELGLNHVLLSVMHGDPETFGVPMRKELR